MESFIKKIGDYFRAEQRRSETISGIKKCNAGGTMKFSPPFLSPEQEYDASHRNDHDAH